MSVLLLEPIHTDVRVELCGRRGSFMACKDELLSKLDSFIRAQEKGQPRFEAIAVRVGVGSFSTLRICQSVANALSFAWGLPVYALLPGESLRDVTQKPSARFLSVRYSGEPHIGGSR